MRHLTLTGVSKSYGGARALDGVSLDLAGGEVHALMGENGAGKSTLIRILAGLERADGGSVTLDGQALPLGSPAAAQAAGFRFLHQELQVVPGLSVAENMHLGHPYPARAGFVRWQALRRAAAAALTRLGVRHIAAGSPMAQLGPGDQMLVRIAATLIEGEAAPPWLYVFDEPTAALSGAEAEQVFAAIAALRAAGCGVLYVSHRMDEVMQLSQRITVLRDGVRVQTMVRGATDPARLIAAMTGREFGAGLVRAAGVFQAIGVPSDTDVLAAAHRGPQGAGLQISGLAGGLLHNLTLSVAPGEIVGIAGLAGSGRNAALKAVMGGIARRAGTVTLAGVPVAADPARAWRMGIAYVPRERRAEGVMLARPLAETVALPHLARLARLRGFLDRRGAARLVRGLAAEVRLKARGPAQPVGQLSGGNQQKVLFARALAGQPRIVLLDEPTRGVDVGARADIYGLIRDLGARGAGVLIASSDLPELIGLCDRIAVLHAGHLTQVLPAAGLSEADLLAACYEAGPDPSMRKAAHGTAL